ncbi:acyl-CoA synthetase [Natrinema sp. 74]|uniref:acyl-CoA synthetase n=1 Tax=Natrinema sp. 74 TaxID=3384159 RepID=UPI0038D47EE7
MVSSRELDAYHFYRQEWDSYDQLKEQFEWDIPETFNMATYACERWADDPGRVAVFYEDEQGNTETYTFWQLDRITNRLAHYLRERGVERGDRVGINLPQRPETVMAHVAVWKLGAVSLPLSTLYGPDGLTYRLDDADAKACIVDEENVDSLREAATDCDALETVLTTGAATPTEDEVDFWEAIEEQPAEFETVATDAEEPALILYTSGTTGDPKGVVHAHRILLGFLPAIVTTVGNNDIRESDLFWSPTEWAWIGTLFLVVVPPLFYGRPILGYNGGSFDPEKAFELIEQYGVTNFFAPPTALRMMMQVDDPTDRYHTETVRTITSGGETLGTNIVDWTDDTFEGAALNDWYGQTEADPIVVGSNALMEFKEGKIGQPAPGVEVALVDPHTGEQITEAGTIGEITVNVEASEPVCFKEYWNKPEKTAKKVQDGWLYTEDLGVMDEDGYIAFHSRKDDVIICSGYRIGPEEVEESVMSHPAVQDAGVVGVSDDVRGEVPKAFVVLTDEAEASDGLKEDIQTHVKDRLAKYEYPRELEFIKSLPQTATGKTKRNALPTDDDR